MTQAEIADYLFFNQEFRNWFRLGRRCNETQNSPVTDFERDWEYKIESAEQYFNVFYDMLCRNLLSQGQVAYHYNKMKNCGYFKIGWEHAEF